MSPVGVWKDVSKKTQCEAIQVEMVLPGFVAAGNLLSRVTRRASKYTRDVDSDICYLSTMSFPNSWV